MKSRPAFSSLLLILLFQTNLRPAESVSVPTLPPPSGSFAIGRVSYDWTDHSRPETLSRDPHAHREIMVYVSYPAAPRKADAAPALYFPGASVLDKNPQAQEALKQSWGSAWPLVLSNRIQIHTFENAPVARGTRRFPLLIFSHGGGFPSFPYTSQIEDLVSHGYVIAAIEHTYEDGFFAFPDGRIIEPSSKSFLLYQNLGTKAAHDWEQKRDDVWAKDIIFVLDQLTRLSTDQSLKSPFLHRIDLNRVGVFGHSIGGRAVSRACEIEPRIKGCINEDGYLTFDGPILIYKGAELPKQPFMFLQQFRHPPTDEQSRIWHYTQDQYRRDISQFQPLAIKQFEGCSGGSYWVTFDLPGFKHFSFTDVPLLQASDPTDSANSRRSLQAIRSYVLAFFDKYLGGKNEPLLQGPSNNPLVKIQFYGKAIPDHS